MRMCVFFCALYSLKYASANGFKSGVIILRMFASLEQISLNKPNKKKKKEKFKCEIKKIICTVDSL